MRLLAVLFAAAALIIAVDSAAAAASPAAGSPAIKKVEMHDYRPGEGARLRAWIDPNGSETSYTLHATGSATEACCPHQICSELVEEFEEVSSGTVRASRRVLPVAVVFAEGLNIAIKYWLVATNAYGTTETAAKHFSTTGIRRC